VHRWWPKLDLRAVLVDETEPRVVLPSKSFKFLGELVWYGCISFYRYLFATLLFVKSNLGNVLFVGICDPNPLSTTGLFTSRGDWHRRKPDLSVFLSLSEQRGRPLAHTDTESLLHICMWICLSHSVATVCQKYKPSDNIMESNLYYVAAPEWSIDVISHHEPLTSRFLWLVLLLIMKDVEYFWVETSLKR
jgi:hypothetical protein